MARRSRYSAEELQAIIFDYRQGVPPALIGEYYGCSESYPVMLTKRRGFPPLKMRGGRRLTKPDRLPAHYGSFLDTPKVEKKPPAKQISRYDVLRMAERGLGVTSIAAALRVPYREIVSIMDAAGLFA